MSTDYRGERSPLSLEQRMKARFAANHAVKTGKIVKPTSCPRCGLAKPSREIHAHHADHTKPLEVDWMCRACHTLHHHGPKKPPKPREQIVGDRRRDAIRLILQRNNVTWTPRLEGEFLHLLSRAQRGM